MALSSPYLHASLLDCVDHHGGRGNFENAGLLLNGVSGAGYFGQVLNIRFTTPDDTWNNDYGSFDVWGRSSGYSKYFSVRSGEVTLFDPDILSYGPWGPGIIGVPALFSPTDMNKWGRLVGNGNDTVLFWPYPAPPPATGPPPADARPLALGSGYAYGLSDDDRVIFGDGRYQSNRRIYTGSLWQDGVATSLNAMLSGGGPDPVDSVFPDLIGNENPADHSFSLVAYVNNSTAGRLTLWRNVLPPPAADGSPATRQWELYQLRLPEQINVNPRHINPLGVIAATGNPGPPAAPGDSHALLLFPAELMVDANRDGRMAFNASAAMPDGYAIHQADAAANDKDHPYRFWINSDDDGIGSSVDRSPGREIVNDPGAPGREYTYDTLRSARGLEDFSRLWVRLAGLNQAIRDGKFQIGLKWKADTIQGTPAIKLFRARQPGAEYLTSLDAALAQVSYDPERPNDLFPPCPAVRATSGATVIGPGATFILPKDFWKNLDEAHPETYLLFEGVGDGNQDLGGRGALTLVFLDNNGRELGESAPLWLEIKNVKSMFLRARAQPDNLSFPYNVSGEFDASQLTVVADPYPLPAGQAFSPPLDEARIALVYVHGHNESYNEVAARSDTLFKRLWWEGFKGRFHVFRWDALVGLADGEYPVGIYNDNEYRAWKYGACLKSFVEGLPAGYTPHVLAHSMGNVVTSSALLKGMNLKSFLMMQAAIPSGCFEDSVNNYSRFTDLDGFRPTPVQAPFGYRLLLGAAKSNAERIVSFYNIQDYALATGRSLSGLVETNWEANEDTYKPDNIGLGIYGFGQIPQWRPAGQQLPKVPYYRTRDPLYNIDAVQPGGLAEGEVPAPLPNDMIEYSYREITDPDESRAFVARPQSKAAGAEPAQARVFGSERLFNLQSVGLGDTRSDHSGQFNQPIQQLHPLFERVLVEIGAKPKQP